MAFDPSKFGKKKTGFDPSRFGKGARREPEETNLEDFMSSREYEESVVSPAQQRVASQAMGIGSPTEAPMGVSVRKADMKEYQEKAKVLSSKKEAEEKEFSELYPEGTIRELDPFRLKDAKISDRARVALRQLLIPDERERAKSLRSMGFKVEEVAGRHVLKDKKSGELFALNLPKLSGQDITTFFSEGIQALPAGAYAAGARTSVSALLRAAGSGFATATGQQLAQKGLGGDFSWLDVAIDTGFDTLGEGVSRFIGDKIKTISPKIQREVRQADSLAEMMEKLNINERELKERLTDGVTDPAAKSRIFAQVEQGWGMAMLERAVYADPAKAMDVENLVKADMAGHVSMLKHTLGAQAAGSRKAMADARRATKALHEKRIDSISSMVDGRYKDAFEGIGEVDVTGLRDRLVDILELTNPSSPEGQRISGFIKQLEPRDGGVLLYDASGREIIKLEKEPELIHNILKTMRRMQSTSTDSNVVQAVSKAFDETFPELNALTGNKLAKADAKYRMYKEAEDAVVAGLFGKGMDVKDLTWGDFTKAVFDSNPQESFASKKYWDMLLRENPDAARNMWGSHWLGKIPEGDVKPSELHKALFGGEGKPWDYAPNPFAARAMRNFEKLIRNNIPIEKLTSAQAMRQFAAGEMDPEHAHFFYIRQALGRAVKSASNTKKANLYFQMAMDPVFSKELVAVVESRPLRALGRQIDANKKFEAGKTLMSRIEGLTERFISKMNIDSPSTGFMGANIAPDVVSGGVASEEEAQTFNDKVFGTNLGI